MALDPQMACPDIRREGVHPLGPTSLAHIPGRCLKTGMRALSVRQPWHGQPVDTDRTKVASANMQWRLLASTGSPKAPVLSDLDGLGSKLEKNYASRNLERPGSGQSVSG